MNIIFGFGQAHEDKGNAIAEKIATKLISEIDTILSCENDYKAAQSVRAILESNDNPKFKFKDSEYNTFFVHFPSVQGEKGNYLISAGFDVSHYRDDHPMSPDGFACMTQKFFVVVDAHEKRFENDEKEVKWFLHCGGQIDALI